MTNAWARLTEWRRAERLRDLETEGSAEWLAAIDAVREARLLYQAEVAQVSARQSESEHETHAHWWEAPLEAASDHWSRAVDEPG